MNGDFEATPQGYPITVNGIDEAVQRACFVIGLIKGSFIYDREMGIAYDGMCSETEDETNEMLTMLCREALADRDDLYVSDAQIYLDDFDPRICFTVHYGGEESETEVYLHTHI